MCAFRRTPSGIGKRRSPRTVMVSVPFGIRAGFQDASTLRVPGRQHYRPGEFQVEGDYSQAAFFAVLGALSGQMDCLGLRRETRLRDREEAFPPDGDGIRSCLNGYAQFFQLLGHGGPSIGFLGGGVCPDSGDHCRWNSGSRPGGGADPKGGYPGALPLPLPPGDPARTGGRIWPRIPPPPPGRRS